MEYRILREERDDLLEAQVGEFLRLGWAPVGGVTVCVLPGDDRTEDRFVWAQAITSTKESKLAGLRKALPRVSAP